MELNADVMNLLAIYGNITPEVVEAARRKQMADILEENHVTIPEPTWREKKKKFVIVIPARYSKDGQRHQIGGRTKRECIDAFKEKVSEILLIRKNLDSIEERAKKITVSETVEEFIRSRKNGLKLSTYERYMRCWKNHVAETEFGNRRLRDIRLPECQQFIDGLYQKKLGFGSIKQIKSVVYQAMDYAVAREYVRTNFMKTTKINANLCSTENKHETSAWSDEEICRLGNGSREMWKHKKFRYSAVYMLMIYTGCRIGELLAATWDDVDWKNKTLTISKTILRYTEYDTGKKILTTDTTKTIDSRRIISLTDEAIVWLHEIKERNSQIGYDGPQLVASRTGKLIKTDTIDGSAKKFCHAIGLPYRSSHTCRRTYVTALADGGVPFSEIAADVGHKNVSTTWNSYYKPRSDAEEIMNKKNRIFGATVGNSIKNPGTLD